MVDAVQRFLLQVFPKQRLDNGTLDKIEAFFINTRLLSKMSPSYEMTSVALIDLMKKNTQSFFTFGFSI